MSKRVMIQRRTLLEMVPYTIQHILKLEKAGKFPPRRRVGENRVGWFLDEILCWQEGRWSPERPEPGTPNGTKPAPLPSPVL